MTHFTKALMLVGVSVLALSACSGDSKGPGQLGSKNDIVVTNKGMPGAQQAAAADSQITSTVESVEPMPPAEVAAGEPVAAPEGAQPLPSEDPAVEAAIQQVEEAKAAVPSPTTVPNADGTPSSTAPATETTPADVAAAQPVGDQGITPPQLEGTATPEEKSAGAPVTQARVYPAQDYPASPAPMAAPAETPAPAAQTPVPVPAPQPAEPAKPGTKGTAYEHGMTGISATESSAAAAPTTVPSGAVNPYDPAMIKAAQTALKAKGGYNGAANGELSSEFLNALSKYQGDNKLAPGGLTIDTLRHLGVIE